MARLLGCFKPRQAKISESSITSLVSKKHSAIAAIITGISSSAEAFSNNDEFGQPRCRNIIGASPVCDGLGILIYPSLLLTTHSTIPSPDSAHDAEINLRYSDTSLNILRRRFLPELFFATDAKLNVTVIACEFVNPEMHPLGLDISKVDKAAYEVGSKVYVLGHDRNNGSPIKLSVGCGYAIRESDSPGVAIRSREEAWLRGSAGFDYKGNFALMVTDSDPENAKALKNTCVSIHSIKSWLEPQWQATKTDTESTPRPRVSLSYRRATYSCPDTGTSFDTCVKEFDTKKGNDNGKITHSSLVLHNDNVDQSLTSRGGEEVGRFAWFNDADVGTSEKADAAKNEGRDEDEKLVAMKSEVMRKGRSMKEDVNAGRLGGKASNSLKVGQVTNEATSPRRIANANPSLEKVSKKTKVVVGPERILNKEKKEVAAQGSSKGQLHSSMDRRAKPTSLQQAFQRDRKSLQLRLHDIPIKDKL